MNKQQQILFAFLFLGFCTYLQAQTISGVTAQQNGNAIDVSYLFDYPEKYLSGTTLFVSGDNGKTWEGPLKNVEFDNTKSESSGIETIQWQDPQKALAIGDQLIFDVRVSLPAKKEYDTEVMLNIGNTGTLCIDDDKYGAVSQGDIIVLDNYIKKGRHVFSIGALEKKVKIHNGINKINLTDCPSTVTDIDGNIYSTVKIGKQCWMQENLKVTHYPNGSPIAYVTDSTAWVKLKNNNTDGAYCYYDNNTNSEYGALYTYAAAIASNWERDKSKGQGICPDGWHLPSDEEWKILKGTVDTKYGVGHNVWDSIGWQGYDAGNFLKSAYGWDNNKNGNNQSGFSGIPGGLRSSNGGFFGIGYLGNWWTSTKFNDGQGWRIRFGTGYKMNRNHYGMSHGYSIRCIKNLQTLKNEGYTETNNNERVACEFPESLYGEWYVNTLWNYSIRKYNGGTRIRTGNKFYYFDSCEQINKDQIIVYAKKDNEEYTFFFHVINNVTMKAKRVKGHKEAWTNEKLSLHTKRLRK